VALEGQQGLSFLGKRWFFCGQRCRATFKREPERWAASRPDAGLEVEGPGALVRDRPVSPFKIR
jgi:hypothetical protein